MGNNTKSFENREISCKKCFAPVGREILDRQVLVIGSLAFFNFARFACLQCEAINGWQAPNLMRGENESLDRRFPDKLSDLPKPEKRILEACLNRESYGIHQHKGGKFVVTVGGYIGSYDTHAEAVKVRDVAVAKNLNYKSKEKQANHNENG
jgi:hypothetical protein